MHNVLAAVLITVALTQSSAARVKRPRATRLEYHSWVEAAKLLQPDTVVVIPLGAALKEHGPHLRLRNDLTLAEYFAGRVEAALPVVITPPLTYHFYPAFLEYPGSTSLTLETSRDSTVEIVRSLARYGPKRFYVLNTGVSTSRALEPAAAQLAQEGILLRLHRLQWSNHQSGGAREAAGDRVSCRRTRDVDDALHRRSIGRYAAGGEGCKSRIHALQAESPARRNGHSLTVWRLG